MKIVKKKQPPKKTPNQDRYLITYADLLTLLFALFIILYSISKPDEERMKEVMQAMNNVFNPNQIIEGNNLNPNISSSSEAPLILFPNKPIIIPDVQDDIAKALASLVSNNIIGFEKIPEGVKITIPNKFLFNSAKAQILPASNDALDSIANIIKGLNMQIQVDGHTDAIPIKSFTYASNWELSAARAVSVVQALIVRGVPAHDLVVRAYGEQRPVADNKTESGKEKNRRVEIIITPKDKNVATVAADSTVRE
jgi:chemotaxis protein MotB